MQQQLQPRSDRVRPTPARDALTSRPEPQWPHATPQIPAVNAGGRPQAGGVEGQWRHDKFAELEGGPAAGASLAAGDLRHRLSHGAQGGVRKQGSAGAARGKARAAAAGLHQADLRHRLSRNRGPDAAIDTSGDKLTIRVGGEVASARTVSHAGAGQASAGAGGASASKRAGGRMISLGQEKKASPARPALAGPAPAAPQAAVAVKAKPAAPAAAARPPVPAPLTSKPLVQFLTKLGLEKYAAPLIQEEVDLAALQHLSDSDFKDLGIPMGPRKKLLAAVGADSSDGAAPMES